MSSSLLYPPPWPTCVRCDTQADDLHSSANNGLRYCGSCAHSMDLVPCDSCDLLVAYTREALGGTYICDDCADRESYYQCDECTRITDGALSQTDRGAEICEECAGSYYSCEAFECYNVVEYRSYLIDTIDGIEICRACMDRDYHMCYDCERAVRDGDYCECSDYNDDGDDGDDHGLYDYGYQPEPIFHGVGPLFMGLELELETSSGAMADCIEIAQSSLGSLAYLKEDSSIDHGFEIVTHPMSHEYAASSFPWGMLDTLARNGADAGYSAGLHVHVSRAAFDGPAHIYRWLKLLYRNAANVSAIARRDSHHWAPFTESDRVSAKDYAKGKRDARRYAAVNVTNDATFEVRVFASSLTSQEVRAALDLVASSVEYTRTLTVVDIVRDGGWDWDAFATWVSDCPEYAALTAEIGVQCAS